MFRIAGPRCQSRGAGKSSPTETRARAAAHNGQPCGVANRGSPLA